MKAYVTSIGERTTELCVWALERQGFEVKLYENSKTTLWQKLNDIYFDAIDDFIRVDADVIASRNILELVKQTDLWWYQSLCYGWFAQDIIHGGVQFVRKECFPAIRQHIQEAKDKERPESYLSRLAEFHNPRVFGTFEKVCGIHGFGQTTDDIDRVWRVKANRGQLDNYDFELAERLAAL